MIDNKQNEMPKDNDDNFDDASFDEMLRARPEILRKFLLEPILAEIREIEEELKNEEPWEPSLRVKIGVNRIFREHFGDERLPYPEIDITAEEHETRV